MSTGRISNQLLFITIILLIFSSLTLSKTITVGINNAAGLDYDYEKIQLAINAAHNGDTIIVAQGTYEESINFIGKNITLTSIDPNAWNMTIIKFRNESIITFSGNENENCTLQGFTIRDGRAPNGGGINGNGTKATIRKCKISNNNSDVKGGGLYNCDGMIDDCIISDNRSVGKNTNTYGGGLYGCDGIINNCIIENAIYLPILQ